MSCCTITIHYDDDETFTPELPMDAGIDIYHYVTKAQATELWKKMIELELAEREHLPPGQVERTPPRKYSLNCHPGVLFAKPGE